MSPTPTNNNTHENNSHERKYKGVRRRKWGKWVSEIRVPGTRERLWLGSYSSAEAAAVAHDVASFCLRRRYSMQTLNFPDLTLPASVQLGLSPKSIQRAASDAGMAIDAQIKLNISFEDVNVENGAFGGMEMWENCGGCSHVSLHEGEGLNISVDDYLY